ncbi:LemA family protein [Candidatus Woesearchaeota archaeon]|nr:LemA family protein [Candidatus Woesearchaeota archaeon]
MGKPRPQKTILLAALAIIILAGIYAAATYNSLVSAQVNVDTAWGQVQSTYQRRVDLIPNLVETVKSARDFEKDVLLSVTEARTKWLSATSQQEQVKAANEVESAIARLLFVAEAYPDIKSNQNFLALQDELAGTENRINVERQRYNTAVGEYNKKTRAFPSSIVASMFGFTQREFFQAQAGAEKAPQVKF